MRREQKRVMEREREREYNKNESRTKTFCVVVFVVQKSFSLRPYSKKYFSKVCVSSCVCFFFLRSRFRVFIDVFFSIFISLLFEMIDTKKKNKIKKSNDNNKTVCVVV